MNDMDWDKDNLALGMPRIDEMHSSFVGLVNRMNHAPKAEFIKLFDELCEHTEAHFSEENQLMDDTGFPSRAEHQAEHRKVLTELKQFRKRVDKGMTAFGQAYVRERLPEWFLLHTRTMDSALVAHLQKN